MRLTVSVTSKFTMDKAEFEQIATEALKLMLKKIPEAGRTPGVLDALLKEAINQIDDLPLKL